MLKACLSLFLLIGTLVVCGQATAGNEIILTFYKDVTVTIDQPAQFGKHKPTLIILYALPNGNTTAQTKGKLIKEGDDWHYNIQHISAQTTFLRQALKDKNIVVCYLENNYKSWPLWKQKHPEHQKEIAHIVDTLFQCIPSKKKQVLLNGHSGGGSFIFGYLASIKQIPSFIQRISFLDSNYGYDSTYTEKLSTWLKQNKKAHLSVFAYNDSVALYNGKPIVSAKGGTWYKSHQMLNDLSHSFTIKEEKADSFTIYRSVDNKLAFFLKPNYNQGIYHTQQVELNGFIHSILTGTKQENEGYTYYGKRCYEVYISKE
jgi:hypothetical protein